MKICSKCQTPKNLEDFVKSTQSSTGRGAHCLQCDQERVRLRRANPDVTIRNRLGALNYRSTHLNEQRGTAKRNRQSWLNNLNKWSLVLLELAKCELVCACCHRIRTQARMQKVA